MKIVQFDRDTKHYTEIRDLGDLKPFTEVSLLRQILEVLKEVPGTSQCHAVFSAADEAAIKGLAEQLVGGIEVDRGLGRSLQGEFLLLNLLLRPQGWGVAPIQIDGDVDHAVNEAIAWSLALAAI